ncbi:MAG: tRNA (N6-isopentenyl adenosine(37)-C2)-methylthiotransferase MiaB [Planctomycetota bacterium]|nr:MAG: tRNA (N6-isopentenyl adenosine(37)-C2)-methylthiotransferase MiaB [Planctomycetota bacterium]
MSSAQQSPTRAKRVYIETFGCQMNVADSDIALARLNEAGYQEVSDADQADLIIYNTCSVRDNAEAKIRGRLGTIKARKAKQPGLRVAVMGCMAQRAQGELLAAHPQLDLVVGTDQFVRLPELLLQVEEEGRLAATDFGDFESNGNWSTRRSDGVNAWIPVMRGCNYNCTYCIVPKTRGREKSRPPELIEAEAREAVAQGHVQITLLGQTVDAYGKTLGDGSNLARLLRRLHDIEGLKRLRFITSHPKDISDELLATMAELPKVAKHLHVPAQCGSDRILRLMGRRYTRAGYLDFVERARRYMPEVELLTDIIVGFPRESEEDFQATRSLMETVNFSGAYVFMYSPRPGTGAANLEDDVPMEVKKARCNELLNLQLEMQGAWYQGLHGRSFEILVEGLSKTNPDRIQGRSIGNLNILVDRYGADGEDRLAWTGQLVKVRITSSTSLSLFAEALSPAMVASGA